jgi:hypothetical protein
MPNINLYLSDTEYRALLDQKDLVGLDNVSLVVRRLVVWFLKAPDQHTRKIAIGRDS